MMLHCMRGTALCWKVQCTRARRAGSELTQHTMHGVLQSLRPPRRGCQAAHADKTGQEVAGAVLYVRAVCADAHVIMACLEATHLLPAP